MTGARGLIWSRHPWHSAAALTLALAIAALAAVVSVDAARWWGRTFPGFLVLPNRLVPVTSLPGWPTENDDGLFLAEVVGVDGHVATTSAEIYAVAAARPPGTAIAYTLRRDGRTWTRTIASRVFRGSDVVLLFGVYILNGVVFGLIGVAVWVLRPDLPAARGMLAFGLTTAAFMLSAAGLYGPTANAFRVHMAAEAFFPAALAHLAFVFPAREGPRHRRAIALAWAGSTALAVVSQLALFDLPRSLALGNFSYLYIGVVSLVFVARMADAYRRGTALERTKIRVVLLAALPGVVFPAVLVAVSGLTGGALPVNAAAFTTFLFPLGLGYATVRRDLFEIDAVVRRLVHYAVLTTLTTLLCLGVLALTTGVLSEAATSPLLPLHFALAVVLLLMPLRDRVQRLVDGICFRPTYNARRVLEDTSAALGSTLDVEVIAATIVARANEALAVEAAALYLVSPEGGFRIAGGYGLAWGETPPMPADTPLVRRLAGGEVVTWYADRGAVGGPLPLGTLPSELVVPMLFRSRLVGFLAIGPRRSGKHYSADDAQFLRTLANQTALSVRHAEAYQALHLLTVTLEQKVTERTAELGRANAELHDSLARLREAYRELEHSQEKLVRAEKMATLGRLAAGVAHEVSTPLGAALSSLQLARELVDEYRDSIDDPSVTRADHHEIAAELNAVARRAEHWTERAARFILAVKAHMRGYAAAPSSIFDVAQVVRETEVLLQHELQAAGCGLRVTIGPGVPGLHGDPTKLGRILANLVSNSVDAYEDARRVGDIDIEVAVDDGAVTIAVRDRGCGIAPEHRDRVFEEMFTTKPPGRGTGLGLAIVRDLVTNHFGGTIALESVGGEGTTFTLRLPGGSADAEPTAARRPAA